MSKLGVVQIKCHLIEIKSSGHFGVCNIFLDNKYLNHLLNISNLGYLSDFNFNILIIIKLIISRKRGIK